MGSAGLLKCPTDICCHIYELLFLYCQPVKIISDEKPDTTRVAAPGLYFLLSCRQIQEEASPVLYSGNVFVFDRAHLYCGKYDDDHMDITSQAAAWPASIGRQVINVGNIKLKFSVPSWEPNLDLTQLLWEMWSVSGEKIATTFATTEGRRCSHSLPLGDELVALNDLFSVLDLGKTSCLSKCVRLRQSFRSIRYDIRDQTVSFETCTNTVLSFTRSSSGQRTRVLNSNASTTPSLLLAFPEQLGAGLCKVLSRV